MAEPTFQIPKEIITPIIQASVNDAVIRALDGPQNVVTKAILGVLNQTVDENGKPCSYGSAKPWIDWVVGDCIKAAAKAAVQKAILDNQPAIQAELVRMLTAKKSPLIRQLAEAMVTGVVGCANTYRLNVEIRPNRD